MISIWKEKKKNEDLEEDRPMLQGSNIKDLMGTANQLPTVQKESFFSEEVTEEERELIRQRVEMQRRQFQEFERRNRLRRTQAIRRDFKHVRMEEALQAIAECNNDEEEAYTFLTDIWNLHSVRKKIAEKHMEEQKLREPPQTSKAKRQRKKEPSKDKESKESKENKDKDNNNNNTNNNNGEEQEGQEEGSTTGVEQDPNDEETEKRKRKRDAKRQKREKLAPSHIAKKGSG